MSTCWDVVLCVVCAITSILGGCDILEKKKCQESRPFCNRQIDFYWTAIQPCLPSQNEIWNAALPYNLLGKQDRSLINFMQMF